MCLFRWNPSRETSPQFYAGNCSHSIVAEGITTRRSKELSLLLEKVIELELYQSAEVVVTPFYNISVPHSSFDIIFFSTPFPAL
jgi:hypothetical protein